MKKTIIMLCGILAVANVASAAEKTYSETFKCGSGEHTITKRSKTGFACTDKNGKDVTDQARCPTGYKLKVTKIFGITVGVCESV